VVHEQVPAQAECARLLQRPDRLAVPLLDMLEEVHVELHAPLVRQTYGLRQRRQMLHPGRPGQLERPERVRLDDLLMQALQRLSSSFRGVGA
jgi:hypothetical protein